MPNGFFYDVIHHLATPAELAELAAIQSELKRHLAVWNDYTPAKRLQEYQLRKDRYTADPTPENLHAMEHARDPRELKHRLVYKDIQGATVQVAQTLYRQKAVPILKAIFLRVAGAWDRAAEEQKARESDWTKLVAEWGAQCDYYSAPMPSITSAIPYITRAATNARSAIEGLETDRRQIPDIASKLSAVCITLPAPVADVK